MLTDLEIAQKAEIKPITEIAKELGIDEDNIYCSDICTKCEHDKYYSYRADGVEAGRNLSLICLK